MRIKAVGNVSLLFIIVLITVISSLAQGGRKCWIKSMVGDVKIQRSKSPKWIKARVNMPLREKDAIRTFVESEAVIQTSEGNTIFLKENTTLELSAFSKDAKGAKKTGIKILTGNLMANVKKLTQKKSKFEFETPTAVAAIRGTKVGFDVDKDKTDIRVYEGRVYVTPKGSRKGSELKSDEMTTIVKGQKDVVIKKLEEKEEEKTRSAGDTTKVDTTKETTDTTSSVDTTTGGKIVLKVISPENGQVIRPGAQVIVSGKVSPASAEVKVKGNVVQVSSTGDFKHIIPKAPMDEGQYNVTVEAAYKGESKTVTRYFIVKDVPVELQLVVNEPANGQVISKPIIRVSGTVTPGAVITVSGMSVPVSSSGSFSKDIPIPDEEGEVDIEIEATLKGKTKTETRTVVYKAPEEDIVIVVQMPMDKQVICDRQVQVKGSVKPASVEEISVNGSGVPVRSGLFSDYIMLPEDQGEQEIEFEVTKGSNSRIMRRIIRFEPASKACNKDIPTIQPTYLPANTKFTKLAFTVFDKTLFDEITFYTLVDGSKESVTGPPGSRFYLELEEGIHKYEVYAEDICGNMSQKVVGTIKQLIKEPLIRLSKPSGPYHLLHIPPGNPDGDFRPEFTVEFSVENLPDDDPKLLKEVRVTNRTSGDVESLKNFSNDIDFDFDMELKRGRNQIIIEVRDVNDRIITKDITIEVK